MISSYLLRMRMCCHKEQTYKILCPICNYSFDNTEIDSKKYKYIFWEDLTDNTQVKSMCPLLDTSK